MKKSSILKRIYALIMFVVIILAMPSQTRAATEQTNFCNLVVFVRFNDDSRDAYNLGDNWTSIKGMYNDDVNSFYEYIKAISRGKCIVNNYIPQELSDKSGVVTYTLSGNKSSYDDDTVIITEVINAINNGHIKVDFGMNCPDNLDSGILDNLTVIVQEEYTSNRDSFLYPHMSVYPGAKDNMIKASAVNATSDIMVCNYNVLNSEALVPFDNDPYHIGGEQSVISHEFLHTLGLPDLYRYNGTGDPVGSWSVMGATTSMFIQYPLSHSREQLGWIDIEEITQSGSYTLNNVTTSSGNVAYKLSSPLSTGEYFIIEYRRKPIDLNSFEVQLPGSGLIIYRVDTSVNPATNAAGNNYIYIFRPDETNLHDGNNVAGAAIEPEKNETGYGSTDLAAEATENTIYYSDGRNSGIEISNVKSSDDGESISFDVNFADYDSLDLWDDVGNGTSVADNIAGKGTIVADSNGKLYVAYTLSNGYGVEIKAYDGNNWTKIGGTISGATTPQLQVLGTDIYLLCGDSQSIPTLYKLESGTWNKKWSETTYANSIAFLKTDTQLFAYYALDNSRLVIRNATTGEIVNNSLTGSYLSNPALSIMDNKFFVLYSDFLASDNKTMLKRLEEDGSWTLIKKYNIAGSNIHALNTNGNKLFALTCVNNTGDNNYSVYDGSVFSENTSLDWISAGILDVQIFAIDDTTYISAVLTGTLGDAKMMMTSAAGWEQCGGDIMSAAGYLQVCDAGDRFYAAVTATGSNKLLVKKHEHKISSSPEEKPAVPVVSTVVSVVPPAGYNDTSLWIDGREYKGTISQGKLSYDVGNKTATTVCMYKYNANGIPTNMYVWTLRYTGSEYEATAQPGLENLMSYHGFSVRVAGQSGIRFKTGVSADLRSKLVSTGVDGFKLVEYGTVVMNKANMSSYPLVKGGNKTTFGRAYWKDGNTGKDLIFETVGGRHRFTSVLIGIPVANYKTEFAFRGYMILNYQGSDYTIYGPVVSRSIYYVSQQVIASGQFSANSAAYKFLEKVISDADAYGK